MSKIKLEKLPSILTETKFNEKGLVETDSGLLVPAYTASELIFSFPGTFFLNNYFYPKLKENGIFPMCPLDACGEYLDLSQINEEMTLKQYRQLWEDFDKILAVINYEKLMPKSKLLIASFDGSHHVDDGVASEVAYFAEKYNGNIIGIRSDIRMCENIASPINAAVRYFSDHTRSPYNSQFFQGIGEEPYKEAFKAIKTLTERIIENSQN